MGAQEKPRSLDDPRGTVSTFLSALFGKKPEHLRMLIWILQGKRSETFSSVDEAVEYVLKCRNTKDVYYGVGLSDRKLTTYERFLARDVRGIVGLWADIDIKHDKAHKKNALPETEEEAYALIMQSGLKPSLVIHSGHGYQALWLFKEPWVFEDKQAWSEAVKLSTWWTGLLRYYARQKGWEVDATQDLARVMRVPGTINHKDPDNEVETALVEYNPEATYVYDDFVQAIGDKKDVVTVAPERELELAMDIRRVANGLVIDSASVRPPFPKWDNLDNKIAKNTYDHKNKNLEGKSCSECDFLLAKCALSDPWQEWSDQEIADLMLAHRKRHFPDQPSKWKMRPDYYARTITSARLAVEMEGKEAQTADTIEAITKTIALGSTPGPRVDDLVDAETDETIDESDDEGDITTGAPLAAWDDDDDDDDDASVAEGESETVAIDEAELDAADDEPTAPPPAAKPAPKLKLKLPAAIERRKLGLDDVSGTVDEDFSLTSTPAPKSKGKSGAAGDQADGDAKKKKVESPLDNIDYNDPEGMREKLLSYLSQMFDPIHFKRIVKMNSTPAMYRLELQVGPRPYSLTLSDAGQLISHTKLQTLLADTGILINQFKGKQWHVLVQAMLSASEEESIGDEATEQGQVYSWLTKYLTEQSIDREWEESPPLNMPFTKNGDLYIYGESFHYWLRVSERENGITKKSMGAALRSRDCEPVTMSIKVNGKQTSRSVWRIPQDIAADFIEAPTFED